MAIRLNEIPVPVTELAEQDAIIRREICSQLGLMASDIKAYTIRKQSLDARRKSRIVYRLQIDVECASQDIETSLLAARSDIALAPAQMIADPLEGLDCKRLRFRHRPVIIGSGPAGIFAALTLARANIPSIIVERGEAVEKRLRTTNQLRSRGQLDPESNFCFGEGGAGTFSDGKLTCGRNHPLIRHVFSEFIRFGAPADIGFAAHPHIGTDYLLQISRNIRLALQEIGCEFLFQSRFEDFSIGASDARYHLRLHDGTQLKTDHLILAIGHSARDTYHKLYEKKVLMVPKPFAMGARIEHPQEVINEIQFGACELPTAAEYKLTAQAQERGIWTFCMCPGGHLLPTSAQAGHLAINGMSYHARNSGFANAAIVVSVRKEDYFRGHSLDGLYFQESVERQAFVQGGSNYFSPAQRLVDFMGARPSRGELRSTYKPGIQAARLDHILPAFITEALKKALVSYNQKMKGFINDRAMIVGVESKTSAPLSILRSPSLESQSHPGLYPTGEGAGFAGGIVSAALDGVKVGQAVLHSALP